MTEPRAAARRAAPDTADATATRAADGRLRVFGLAVLAAFVVLGLFGRDPWKADEPYSIGMVLNFATGHDWIVPHVGADPFVEKPPLMYWTGALFARATQEWLPLHEGAMLAVLGWVAGLLWLLAATARRLYGGRDGRGMLVCVLLLGTVGLVTHIHKLTADVPQLAGAMLALYALVRAAREPASTARASGVLLGTGVGIAFLAKGILVPGILGVTCVAALAFPAFRTRAFAAVLGWAVLASLPWLLVWPALFWHASHARFIEWIWDNNIGRFFGFGNVGELRASYWSEDIRQLVGLSFPVGWLAVGGALAAWRGVAWRDVGARLQQDPARLLLWLYVIVTTGTLVASASVREIYLMPLYPALALLAAGVTLPPWLARVWRGVALLLFSLLGVLAWALWAQLLSGRGDVWPHRIGRWLPLDYHLSFGAVAFVAGVVVTALWLVAIGWRRRLPAAMLWLAGLTLAWGLMHSLLLPWLNEARSYRTPFVALRQALPAHYDCVATLGLGESEVAMLHYFAGAKAVRVAAPGDPVPCDIWLVLDKASHRIDVPASAWQEFWHGGRAGDDNERFRAFRRLP